MDRIGMMHHSRSIFSRPRLRPQLLLGLCAWLSIPLGTGILSLRQQAQAIDLENHPVLESDPVVADPAPAAPVDTFIEPAAPPAAPALESAAPVDTFIDPDPTWEPAPVAPPVIPESVVQPDAPAPTSTAPAVSPQIMPLPQAPPVAEQAPAPESPAVDPRPAIAPAETAATPAPAETAVPAKPILSGSVSGCQASLDVDPVIAATLCGPSIQTAQQSPQANPQAAPSAPAPSYAYQPSQPSAPGNVAQSYPSPYKPAYVPKTAPTAWVKGAPSTSPHLLASAAPGLKLLPSSPNPLKWMVPNQQRMIFPLPMPASISSAFGQRTHPISGLSSFHAGTDLAAPQGTPVLAAYPGQVDTAGFMGGYGLAVLLQHQDGQLATRYAHLSKIYVQPGQWISQGTVIGLVGSTGNSTGPHLHFETLRKQNGTQVAFDSGIQLKASLTELLKAMQTAKVPAAKRSNQQAGQLPSKRVANASSKRALTAFPLIRAMQTTPIPSSTATASPGPQRLIRAFESGYLSADFSDRLSHGSSDGSS